MILLNEPHDKSQPQTIVSASELFKHAYHLEKYIGVSTLIPTFSLLALHRRSLVIINHHIKAKSSSVEPEQSSTTSSKIYARLEIELRSHENRGSLCTFHRDFFHAYWIFIESPELSATAMTRSVLRKAFAVKC